MTDPSGASVGGAVILLTDAATNGARRTATNEAGRYDFVNLPPGVYDLTVSKDGFAQAKLSAQRVDVGLALTLNVVLQVGVTATTVEVKAATPGP